MTLLSGSERGSMGPPADVQVTVVGYPSERRLERWIARRLGWLPARLQMVGVAAVPAAVVAVVLAAALGVGSPAAGTADVRAAGAAGVIAASGYPPACLTVTISARNRAYARADFARRGSCELDSGFPTAIFHRSGGEWHPFLYTVSYPCPVPSVPRSVQRQLELCR
jgi:hypothetical protein